MTEPSLSSEVSRVREIHMELPDTSKRPVCGDRRGTEVAAHCSGVDHPVPSPAPSPLGQSATDATQLVELDTEAEAREEAKTEVAESNTVNDRSIVSCRVHNAPAVRSVECGDILGGRYELIAPIGAGGFGTVYDAQDQKLQKRVAVKVLAANLKANPGLLERFQREAIAASQVGHPGVISVSDFGRDSLDMPYLVMEFLEGRDLAAELHQRGPLSIRRALGIAIQTAQALSVVHAKGILHRDLKPANIFLTQCSEDDQVKVVDFGASKFVETSERGDEHLTTGQIVIGTPAYMTPEQALARADIDRRTDIYALGIILFEMLSGAPPFEGPNQVSIISKHLSVKPPLLSSRSEAPVSARLDRVIARTLEKKPGDRFGTMEELAQELRTVLEEVESPSQSGSRKNRELRKSAIATLDAYRKRGGPISEPRVRVAPVPAQTQGGSPLRRTILCIDDSDAIRIQLMRILDAQGFNVVAAKSGIEAIQITRSLHVDLFLVDINMALMSGIALANRLRQHDAHAQTPIVFMTTSRSPKTMAKGRSLGVTDWLRKPLLKSDVVACAHRSLVCPEFERPALVG